MVRRVVASRFLIPQRIAAVSDAELCLVRKCEAHARTPWGRRTVTALIRLANGWLYPPLALGWLYSIGKAAFPIIFVAVFNASILHCLYQPIKRFCCRTRPCQIAPDLRSTFSPLDAYSFPSGHAMTLTGVLIPMVVTAPRLFLPATAIWLLIAWSRLAFAHHYPTDIVAGSALSFGVACPISIWLLPN